MNELLIPSVIAALFFVLLVMMGLSIVYQKKVTAVLKNDTSPEASVQLSARDALYVLAAKHPVSAGLAEGKEQGNAYNFVQDHITLSLPVIESRSAQSIAVAAHEFAHARQAAIIRPFYAPFSRLIKIASQGAFLLILAVTGHALWQGTSLADVPMYPFALFFFVNTVMTGVTLGMEIDANRKAVTMLWQDLCLQPPEITWAKRFLRQALMSYWLLFAKNMLVFFIFVLYYVQAQ